MDWDKLIEMAKDTERCARIARENIEATARYWRERESTEVQLHQIEESPALSQRRRLYHE